MLDVVADAMKKWSQGRTQRRVIGEALSLGNGGGDQSKCLP